MSHSSDVSAFLEHATGRISLARITPRSVVAHVAPGEVPAGDAVLVVIVDGVEQRRAVELRGFRGKVGRVKG